MSLTTWRLGWRRRLRNSSRSGSKPSVAKVRSAVGSITWPGERLIRPDLCASVTRRNSSLRCLRLGRASWCENHELCHKRENCNQRLLEVLGMKKETGKLIERAQELAKPYCVSDGKKFRLKHCDPGDTAGLTSEAKPRAKEALQMGISLLAELQDMLYAQDRWALLLIFQAMDAAGKDGAIKHVMSGVNPQGCEVYSFKSPSTNELDHDYLWRTHLRIPERGRIGIFNRSYY